MIKKLTQKIAFIGVALGLGAQKRQTEQGPEAVQSSQYINKLIEETELIEWQTMLLDQAVEASPSYAQRLQSITHMVSKLAFQTAHAIEQGVFPIVIGGDHAMAVGTWSGIIMACDAQAQFGLIWFDAHMDAHTPETSPSMAIHGMPVAVLLGQGEAALVNTYATGQKIHPQHLVLIGPRDFEIQEADLLAQLGVKVFSTHEIQERGFEKIAEEALAIVTKGTKGFGISIDLDGFDPVDAPGTGSYAPNGLTPESVLPSLAELLQDPRCKGLEIAEFNPVLDKDHKTLHLIEMLIRQKIQ